MVYKIRKGCHRAGWFLRLTKSRGIKGKIKFLSGFDYNIKNQKDTNKIVGLSDGWFHHINSVRLGWRWNLIENRIEIMTIVYSNKKRTISHLCFTDGGVESDYEIILNKNNYTFRFDNIVYIAHRSSRWNFYRYCLYPFFGGKEKAPKEIKLELTINKFA